jgi:hypothetical protein
MKKSSTIHVHQIYCYLDSSVFVSVYCSEKISTLECHHNICPKSLGNLDGVFLLSQSNGSTSDFKSTSTKVSSSQPSANNSSDGSSNGDPSQGKVWASENNGVGKNQAASEQLQ